MTIIVKYKNSVLFTNCDYNFSFKFFEELNAKSKLFAYIVFINVVVVQIKNASNIFFVVLRNIRIKDLHDYKKKSCYMISIDNQYFVAVLISD